MYQTGGVLAAHQRLRKLHADVRLRVTEGARGGHLEGALGRYRVLPFAALLHRQRLAVPAQHHRRRFAVAANTADPEPVAEPGGAVVPFNLQAPVRLGGGDRRLDRQRVGLIGGGELAVQPHAGRRLVHRRQGIHPQAQLLAQYGQRQLQRWQAVVDPGQFLGKQRQRQFPAPFQRRVGADFQAVAVGEHRLETDLRRQTGDAFGGLFQCLLGDHRVGETYHQRRAGAHCAGGPAVQVAAPAAVHGGGVFAVAGRGRGWRGSLPAGGRRAGFLGGVAGQQGEGQKQHA